MQKKTNLQNIPHFLYVAALSSVALAVLSLVVVFGVTTQINATTFDLSGIGICLSTGQCVVGLVLEKSFGAAIWLNKGLGQSSSGFQGPSYWPPNVDISPSKSPCRKGSDPRCYSNLHDNCPTLSRATYASMVKMKSFPWVNCLPLTSHEVHSTTGSPTQRSWMSYAHKCQPRRCHYPPKGYINHLSLKGILPSDKLSFDYLVGFVAIAMSFYNFSILPILSLFVGYSPDQAIVNFLQLHSQVAYLLFQVFITAICRNDRLVFLFWSSIPSTLYLLAHGVIFRPYSFVLTSFVFSASIVLINNHYRHAIHHDNTRTYEQVSLPLKVVQFFLYFVFCQCCVVQDPFLFAVSFVCVGVFSYLARRQFDILPIFCLRPWYDMDARYKGGRSSEDFNLTIGQMALLVGLTAFRISFSVSSIIILDHLQDYFLRPDELSDSFIAVVSTFQGGASYLRGLFIPTIESLPDTPDTESVFFNLSGIRSVEVSDTPDQIRDELLTLLGQNNDDNIGRINHLRELVHRMQTMTTLRNMSKIIPDNDIYPAAAPIGNPSCIVKQQFVTTVQRPGLRDGEVVNNVKYLKITVSPQANMIDDIWDAAHEAECELDVLFPIPLRNDYSFDVSCGTAGDEPLLRNNCNENQQRQYQTIDSSMQTKKRSSGIHNAQAQTAKYVRNDSTDPMQKTAKGVLDSLELKYSCQDTDPVWDENPFKFGNTKMMQNGRYVNDYARGRITEKMSRLVDSCLASKNVTEFGHVPKISGHLQPCYQLVSQLMSFGQGFFLNCNGQPFLVTADHVGSHLNKFVCRQGSNYSLVQIDSTNCASDSLHDVFISKVHCHADTILDCPTVCPKDAPSDTYTAYLQIGGQSIEFPVTLKQQKHDTTEAFLVFDKLLPRGSSGGMIRDSSDRVCAIITHRTKDSLYCAKVNLENLSHLQDRHTMSGFYSQHLSGQFEENFYSEVIFLSGKKNQSQQNAKQVVTTKTSSTQENSAKLNHTHGLLLCTPEDDCDEL